MSAVHFPGGSQLGYFFASVVLFIILPLIFFTVIDDPKTVNQVKDGIKKDNEEESLPKEMTAKDLLSKKVLGKPMIFL